MDEMLNRQQLAERWGCSTRKIDRLRKNGDLAWMDLTAKKGRKPIVRFRAQDIKDFEENSLLRAFFTKEVGHE